MFKRANKITALLVAAASVMSVVPAMASDRLGTKDGTIKNAVAYSDGKYVYEGYRTDDDDDAMYYNDGSSDKALDDDVEDADLIGAYGEKYAFANDGSDQYTIDLSSGDVLDDTTPEDDADNAATKLKTKLKKTDRYGSDIDVDAEDNLGYVDEDNTGVLGKGNKFGSDTWYEYAVVPTSTESKTEANLVGTKLYGFTNGSGKYIDASNLANIYAYSTAKGKYTKIEEFSNTLDDVDDDSKLLATLIKAPEFLAQDKDYIYAKVTVAITDTDSDAVITGGTSTSAAAYTDASEDSTAKTTIRTYIQKISKEQGDQVDDAYTPSTVVSYEVATTYDDRDSELDCTDADDAADAIADATDYAVYGDQLLAIYRTDDNVKVTSLNLKKDKVEYTDDDDDAAYRPTDIDSGDEVDAYLVEKDDDDDIDVDDDDESTPYDIDIDGNLWVVADGGIYKFASNEFNKVYSCDSSLNSISVYDENNLITWEQDGDIYTTVAEGEAETASEAPAATTTPAIVGWSQLADGTWNFYDTTGTKVVSNWVNVGGVWYYLKADGVMATGWLQDGGTWYYLNGSGAMQTGWLNDNGTWYYLTSSGAMATGWINDNGTWYYLSGSGAMLANTTVDGYKLAASGAWIR